MRRIIACFIVLCVSVVPLYARPKGKGFEECEMHKHKGPIFGDVERMKEELKLTDEQVDKIIEINKQYEKRMLDIREKLAPKMVQLRKLLLEDQIDINAVRSKLKEIGDLRIELHILRIQHVMDIEKLLTREQLKKLREHKHKEMRKHERMRLHNLEFDEPLM